MLQQFDERNRDLIVNVDGTLVHRDEAGVSSFDPVVQGGDAVWEGLRPYDGRIFKLAEHLARLRSSARALAVADILPDEEIIEEVRRTLTANRMRDGMHIPLTLTRGAKFTGGMDPRLNQSRATLIVLAEHKAPVYDRVGPAAWPRVRCAALGRTRWIRESTTRNLLQSILAKIEANAAAAADARRRRSAMAQWGNWRA
ncbi:aminotransferase class IV [Candidatus Palauibacter sp.]|uniref:aminotransferase class IV n=1 Tax=Candidatus Palauibacter sp. TaxID=3101350 RepID=UPI003B021A0D